MPVVRPRRELEEALSAGAVRVLNADPFAYLGTLREEDIQEGRRAVRDSRWRWIEPLVGSPEALFRPESRGQAIRERACELGITRGAIYLALRHYYQRGLIPNALIPRYDLRGAPGKERHATAGAVKRGRPTTVRNADGGSIGVNVTDEDIRKMVKGYERFFKNGQSLVEVWEETKRQYFKTGLKQLPSGLLVPVVPPASELPTFEQFIYYTHKTRGPEEKYVRKHGRRQFLQQARPITGDGAEHAYGPGSIYQVDWTWGNIELVSSFNKNVKLGKLPLIYLVVDVWSRMIVGVHISLANASWAEAAMAFAWALSDKVPLYARYGIDIRTKDFPCVGRPDEILADRGEIVGLKSDALVNALGIRACNNPPYRPDLKPFVESAIGRLKKRLADLPGVKPKHPTPGGRHSYAALTFEQFVQLFLLEVLHYNMFHVMENYTLTPELIADDVKAVPLDLWNWGMRHGGALRPNIGDPRLSLLPREEASVTEDGILFKDVLYTAKTPSEQNWFSKARQDGRWHVNVVCDPLRTSIVFLHIEDSNTFEPCTIVEKSKVWADKSFDEVAIAIAHRKAVNAQSKEREQTAEDYIQTLQDEVIQTALKATMAATRGKSKSSREKGSKEALEIEKQLISTAEERPATPERARRDSPPPSSEAQANLKAISTLISRQRGRRDA